MLDGHVEEEDGRLEFRSTDGVVVPLATGRSGKQNIIFRPQNLTIAAPDAKPDEGTIRLTGEVSHREFLGNRIRYSVKVGEHTIQVDDVHRRGHPALDLGARVSLFLSADQVIALSE